MILVFDTNSLFHHLKLNHPLFELLAFYGRDFDISVAFPEVVIEECIRHHRDRLAEAYSELEKSVDTIARNSFDRIEWTDPRKSEFHKLNWYREYISQRVDQLGFLVPCNSIQSTTLLARCQDRRSPFGAKTDKGFKDALIWESILIILKTHEDDLVFITNDNHFYKDKDSNEIHSHLQEDLDKINAKDRITFERDLSCILDKHIWTRLQRDSKAEAKYLTPDSGLFSISQLLDSFIFSSVCLPGGGSPGECNLPEDSEKIQLTNWRTLYIDMPIVYLLKEKRKLYIFEAEGTSIVYYREKEPLVPRAISIDSDHNLMHVRSFSYTRPLNLQEKRRCRIKVYVTVEDGDSQWKSIDVRLLKCWTADSDE